MEAYKLLTVAQIAERFDVDDRTVRGWYDRGLFPNAIEGPRTGRGAIWLVPEGDLVDFVPPRRGPKPKAAAAAEDLGAAVDDQG